MTTIRNPKIPPMTPPTNSGLAGALVGVAFFKKKFD